MKLKRIIGLEENNHFMKRMTAIVYLHEELDSIAN